MRQEAHMIRRVALCATLPFIALGCLVVLAGVGLGMALASAGKIRPRPATRQETPHAA